MTDRYNPVTKHAETNEDVDNFIADIKLLYQDHGIALRPVNPKIRSQVQVYQYDLDLVEFLLDLEKLQHKHRLRIDNSEGYLLTELTTDEYDHLDQAEDCTEVELDADNVVYRTGG